METLRTSSYLIPVKLDSEQDKYMLIHGYTGAIDIVSSSLLEKIKSRKEALSPETMQLLQKRGYITTKTPEEERVLANKIAKAVHAAQQKNCKKRFFFLVNYSCNFRCPYCFENAISNKGKMWSHQIFTKEMVDCAYSTMKLIEPDVNKHYKGLVLYGGEPLMAENVEIVNYIFERGISSGYHFRAITNGYDLDLYSNLLGKGGIEHLQITLDGDKKYNDSRRFHYKHGGSYDKIIRNVQMALDKGVQVRIRSNVDYNNFESVSRLNEYFHEAKFYDYSNFSFYRSPLSDTVNSLLSPSNKKRFDYMGLDRLEDLTLAEEEQEFDKSNSILLALKDKTPINLRPSNCGANKGIHIFDPCGDIYSCLEVVGLKKHVIAHYGKDLVWTTQCKMWKGRTIDKITECSSCRYALLCGGGCGARTATGELMQPNCENFPAVLETYAKKAYAFINQITN